MVAVYGRQFQVTVPAQIGYSRGADGLVVRNEIKKINDLKGKIIATGQFTEVDFFMRYLAQEAGLEVNMLGSLDATPSPDRLNLVYTEEGFAAGDLFLDDVKSGRNKLAGCVTWEPKVSEVVRQAGGVAHVLTSNRNLLVIADILVVNKGFAQANAKMVAGLVQGLLEGNKMVRDNQDAHVDVVAKAFKWTREQARGELAEGAPVEPAGEPGVLLRRDRRGGQLRRHLSVGGARLRQRAGERPAGSVALRRSEGARRRSRRRGSSRIRRSPSRRSARAAADRRWRRIRS